MKLYIDILILFIGINMFLSLIHLLYMDIRYKISLKEYAIRSTAILITNILMVASLVLTVKIAGV